MKVAHLIRSLDPATGGPPVVATRLAAALALRGHAVELVAEVVPDPLPADLLPGAAAGRVPVRRLPRVGLFGPAGALDAVAEWADVVHLPGVWEPLVLRAAAAARRH